MTEADHPRNRIRAAAGPGRRAGAGLQESGARVAHPVGDDALLTWRRKHVLTIERIIGGKRGTGGTAGVACLQNKL